MSLVVTDSDGEQNEMRQLQDKLVSTMKVVTTLTTQLTELKEQVFAHSDICTDNNKVDFDLTNYSSL